MQSKNFYLKKGISYKEVPGKESDTYKFYEIKNSNRENIIEVPDGCIHIQCLFTGAKSFLRICGGFTKGRESTLGDYERCIGIKFAPGRAPEYLQKQAEGLSSQRIDGRELIPNANEILEIMEMSATLEEKRRMLEKIFSMEHREHNHRMVEYILKKVQISNGYVPIKSLIDSIGYSQRYTERTFKKHIGFSIKKYAEVIRMQNALELLIRESADDYDIYEKLGYYDQAHFIHDFKNFTSLTPNAYKRQCREEGNCIK